MNKYVLRRIIAAIGIVLVVALLLAARPVSKTVMWQEYIISSGDTLWTIAREEYGDSVDIRRVIADIEKMNEIVDAGKLMPGDVILIPWEEE